MRHVTVAASVIGSNLRTHVVEHSGVNRKCVVRPTTTMSTMSDEENTLKDLLLARHEEISKIQNEAKAILSTVSKKNRKRKKAVWAKVRAKRNVR